nr:MAG TPA: hypothetical protein [Caudoviricetes sp.]
MYGNLLSIINLTPRKDVSRCQSEAAKQKGRCK